MSYLNYQIDIAVLFGADRKRAEIEMTNVVEFEIELAKISLTNDKRRDADAFYNPITIRDLQHKHPYIDWVSNNNNRLTKKKNNINYYALCAAQIFQQSSARQSTSN
jgi:predicted metalloendopeptidase